LPVNRWNGRGSVLNDYIRAALKRAVYEELEDGEGWYASIPVFPGAWAASKTIEETREELASVLEGCLILALREGDTLPTLYGLDLTPPLPVVRAS
jgi:predicted RNase H-like HicB family nuclease